MLHSAALYRCACGCECCSCVCVCVCVCSGMCMCVWLCVAVHTSMQGNTHSHTHTHTIVSTHAYTDVHMRTCTYTYTHVSTCRPELALCLLAEVAYEHDEDFRPHMPLLLHACICVLDQVRCPHLFTHTCTRTQTICSFFARMHLRA